MQVGFNRRYSPFASQIKRFFENRSEPMILFYRVNAGHLPKDHWVYDKVEGGSRFISELCHFIDFCRFVVGSKIVDSNYNTIDSDLIFENELMENLSFFMKFADFGSHLHP